VATRFAPMAALRAAGSSKLDPYANDAALDFAA
jgi:hypothetical protein